MGLESSYWLRLSSTGRTDQPGRNEELEMSASQLLTYCTQRYVGNSNFTACTVKIPKMGLASISVIQKQEDCIDFSMICTHMSTFLIISPKMHLEVYNCILLSMGGKVITDDKHYQNVKMIYCKSCLMYSRL